jgi:hypothetical protein
MKETSILSEVRKDPTSFTWGPVKEIIDVGSRYTFLHVVNGDEMNCGYHIFVDGRTIYRLENTIEAAMIVAIANGKRSSNTEAMESAHPKLRANGNIHFVKDFINSVFHLFGGLIGKGHTKDFVGTRSALPDHVGHAMSKNTGFTGACARQDQ